MHTGIDARSIFTGGGGDRTYFRSLIQTMARLYPQDRWTLYAEAPDADRDTLAAPNVAIAAPLPARIGALWNVTALTAALRRDRVDILHAQYMLPPFGTVSCPMVVTIHDITFRLFPHWFPRHQNRVQNFLIPQAARRAGRVITGSECACDDMVSHMGVPREKIALTPYGVSNRFRPADAMAIDAARARYEVPERYLFGVGILRKRKNAVVVLRAMDRLVERGEWPRDIVLVLTGNWTGDREAAAFFEASERLNPLVKTIGFVQDNVLPALLTGALGVVYPSRYEGFGLPVLEAMACGAPVVSSNASSLPEVVGDAGLLRAPDDVEGWSDALKILLTNHVQRHELSRRGLLRAKQFTWERTARETMAVYQSLVEE